MQLITFICDDGEKKTRWGQFGKHKGYMQAIDFAKYLLKSTCPEDFKAVVSHFDGDKNIIHTEYSLNDYIKTFS